MKDKRAARRNESLFFSIVCSASRTPLSSLCVLQTTCGFGDLSILSSRIRHRPDTVGHSHPRKHSSAQQPSRRRKYALVAMIWLITVLLLCMLADGLGFIQESDNHRDSGNLVVAKWRVSGSGDKRPGARGQRGQAEAINVSEALGVVTACSVWRGATPRPKWAYHDRSHSPDAIERLW